MEQLSQSPAGCGAIWSTLIHNDGRRYVFKFESYDYEALMRHAEFQCASIDHMRSPSLSAAKQINGLWTIHLTYYGLD